jgi:hypothetical protein
MSTYRDFERVSQAWLAEGPTTLADRVLDEALADVHLTHQRRGLLAPWRYAPVNRFAATVAAVVVVAAVAGGAVLLLGRSTPSVGAPTASPGAPSPTIPAAAPTELPTSELVPITSAQYGYSIKVPKTWGVQAATRTLHGTEPLWGSQPETATPGADSIMGSLFGDTGPNGRLLIAGSPAPPGTSLPSWTAGTAELKCGTPTSQSAMTIGGETGTLSTYPACSGLFVQWLTVLHGGWAWHVAWLDNPGSEAADVVVFKQLIATFQFGEIPASSPGPS